ncbi:PIH1 domain-containing protein 1 [Cladochytrium tenue]|nr:PIH1 domain-containing protein 1 [Cladochytrium tenue]
MMAAKAQRSGGRTQTNPSKAVPADATTGGNKSSNSSINSGSDATVPAWARGLGEDAADEDVWRTFVASLNGGKDGALDSAGGGDAGDARAMAALRQALANPESPDALAAVLQALGGGEGDGSGDKDGDDTAPSDQSARGAAKKAAAGAAGMVEIQPQAGLVLKTRLAAAYGSWPAGIKVFVNVCHSSEVPAPPTTDYEEVARLVAQGDSTGFKVPLSLAGPRPDCDKEGSVCLVFEACINTAPFEMMKKNEHFHALIVQICFEWLEEKHKIELERSYTVPKMKSKGPLSKHSVRRAPKQLITEMSKTVPSTNGTPTPKGPGPAPVATSSATGTSPVQTAQETAPPSGTAVTTEKPVPWHELLAEPAGAEVPEFLVVRVRLPKLASTSGAVAVDVEPRRVLLTPVAPSCPYLALEVALPSPVDVEQAGAQFDRARRILTVTLFVDEDRARAAG